MYRRRRPLPFPEVPMLYPSPRPTPSSASLRPASTRSRRRSADLLLKWRRASQLTEALILIRPEHAHVLVDKLVALLEDVRPYFFTTQEQEK